MNRLEANLQSKIIGWLKSQGAYVIKAQSGPGVPAGTPDVLAFLGASWIALEVKASKGAKRQPLQKIQLARMSQMNPGLVHTVYPENWERVKKILTANIPLKPA